MAPLPPIPTSFASKKAAIISSLSAPEDTYADLSPKGTVDDAIKDLIDRINALEGIVTTSSCAGRVSVFLEGRKHIKTHNGQDVREDKEATETQAAVPGGKGMGGRWLFMSHEPANLRSEKSCLSTSKQLGIEPMRGREPPEMEMEPSELRIARFQFEPMILHIMAASLHHAQTVLSAAINSGFRESGIQSLKNLDDPNSFPMIAIRSSGLALESVVGAQIDEDDDIEDEVYSIVSEDYLKLLIKLANGRFKTNTERMKRFEDDLFGKEARREMEWEDGQARKERKRAEGLAKQNGLRKEAVADIGRDYSLENGTLFGALPMI